MDIVTFVWSPRVGTVGRTPSTIYSFERSLEDLSNGTITKTVPYLGSEILIAEDGAP